MSLWFLVLVCFTFKPRGLSRLGGIARKAKSVPAGPVRTRISYEPHGCLSLARKHG